jgi:phosphatidate phosphatase PAH1
MKHKTDDMKTRFEEFDKKLNTRLNDTNFVVENAEMEGFFLDDVGYADDGNKMVEENSIEQDDFTLMINILGQKLW